MERSGDEKARSLGIVEARYMRQVVGRLTVR